MNIIMMEITTIKQYRNVPNDDFILLLRKPHSKDKLHKPTCDSLKISDILLKSEGLKIDPDFAENAKFNRNADYYHVKSNEKQILIEYNEKKCKICLIDINFLSPL